MKLKFILIMSVMSRLGLSQDFEIVPKEKDFTHYGDLDYIDIEARIYNRSANPADTVFVWERTTRSPEGWSFTVCDTENCWLPSVEKNTFFLAVGEDWIFNVAMYPAGIAGQGEATILIYPDGKKHLAKSYVYKGIASATNGIFDKPNLKSDFSLYPNPCVNSINIAQELPLGSSYQAAIIDSNGDVLRSTEIHGAFKNFDTSELKEGCYLLRITSDGKFYANEKFLKKSTY